MRKRRTYRLAATRPVVPSVDLSPDGHEFATVSTSYPFSYPGKIWHDLGTGITNIFVEDEWISVGGGAFVRADKDGDGDYDPLTSTSWDGDSYSNATGTINANTVFGVPTTAKAVVLLVTNRDSGGGGSGMYFKAKSTGTNWSFECRLTSATADSWHAHQGVVPVAADGTIYYEIAASGASTMDVYIIVIGWLKYIESDDAGHAHGGIRIASLFASGSSTGGLEEAIDDLSGSDGVVYLPPASYPIDSDYTIPANAHVIFAKGAICAVANTKTLTINGTTEAGMYQIFSLTGTGKATLNNVKEVYPQWWGAVGDGVTDDAAAFQAAIATGKPVFIPASSSYYIIGTSLDLTPGDVPIHDLAIQGAGIGGPLTGLTRLRFDGTGYLFKAWDTAGNPGALRSLKLANLSMTLGTSGTGLIQMGRLAHAYNATYFRNNHHYSNLYLVGDITGGDWRAGTIGMSTKQLASCQFDNVMIHNFETCWIQDTHTECQYNKIDLNTFNDGVDIRGQTTGLDKSTFINPAIHGPNGAAVDGYALKVNAGGITMLNALYEPNGSYTGSGNNLIWILYYGQDFKDIGGDLAIAAAATDSFDNTLKVDQMGGGYLFYGTLFTDTGAPGVTIAAPDVNPASIGRFSNCWPQLRTVIQATSANIGRYAWIGPEGTSNDYVIDVPKLTIAQASTTGAAPVVVLDQADVDEDYFKIIGTSDTNVDRALVDAADFSTIGAIKGYLKIYVQDDQATNPIPDGDYYIPFYAVPTP